MKLSMLSVLLVAASATAIDRRKGNTGLDFLYPWDGMGWFNASGSVSLPAYDLSKPASEQPDDANRPVWIVTERTKYVASRNTILSTSLLTDPEHRVSKADNTTNRALTGWDLSHWFYSGLLRNTTDPVKADCSGGVVPAGCLDLIKKAGATDNEVDDEALNLCSMISHNGYVDRQGRAQFLASRQGNIGPSAVSGDIAVSTYDDIIRRPAIVYARWDYDSKTVSEQLLCFGYDHYEPHSRTLAEALGVKAVENQPDGASASAHATTTSSGQAKPTDAPGGKPGDKTDDKGSSASSTTAVSWYAGVGAIVLLAL